MSQDIIAGRNPVKEALRAGRTLNKIMIMSGVRVGSVKDILDLARSNKVPVQKVDKSQLDKITKGVSHQGVVALAAARDYVDIDQIIEKVQDKQALLVLLDEVHDPHNLGAIIRTADAAGVDGVIIPRRRAVALTATVAKASAGAVEHLPVARVANLAQTIKQLQHKGFWVVGADMDGQENHWDAPLDGSIALVIGGEGKGLGRLIKERCDMVVKLPMLGKINSLNASVAAALLIYEVVRQRNQGKSNA